MADQVSREVLRLAEEARAFWEQRARALLVREAQARLRLRQLLEADGQIIPPAAVTSGGIRHESAGDGGRRGLTSGACTG